MVRARTFDEDAVLTGAMKAFRRHGYAGMALPELQIATGISVGSLYNAYGDKRGIFLAAFQHYLKTVLERRIARFATPSQQLAGLRQLFLSLLHEPGGEKFGCLITNSAIEFGPDGGISGQTTRKGFEILEQLFLERLQASKSSGTLRPDIDAKSTATRLLALYQGVLVLIRGGYDHKMIRRAINFEFDSLERSPDET
jgi:TetR/AcrR family transcriptional regulator, transcriptional repressor for nem operon